MGNRGHVARKLMMPVRALVVLVVSDLKPVPRAEQVQVENVFLARLKIQSIEERACGPNVVKGAEFRSVQETAGPFQVEDAEVAPTPIAKSQSGFF